MKQHKWACIVNPVAGNGYGEKHLDLIKDQLKLIDEKAPLYITEYPGHGVEITKQLLKEGFDTILVAGGDGSAHEVGSVLVGNKDAAMGIISAGTGNDYNYMAGFPGHFEQKHWDRLKTRSLSQFDVGLCNNQYFFNGMGIGFDAEMSANSQSDREKTGKSGKGRYTWIIIKTLLGYKEKISTISIDGNSDDKKSFLTTIAIGRRFAGSYFLTPSAIADDGLLDICHIDSLSLFKRLAILLKVPKGSHIKEKSVSYYQCQACSLDFNDIVPAHLDGELIYDRSFHISIKKKSLNIITNL